MALREFPSGNPNENAMWLLFVCVACLAASLAAASASWLTAADIDAQTVGLSSINLGLFRACFDSSDHFDCAIYGEKLDDIPHLLWRVAAILYGVGLMFSWSAFFVSLVSSCGRFDLHLSVSRHIFFVGVLCLSAGTATFLAGLQDTNPEFGGLQRTSPCPGAHLFDTGSCDFDWGLILACASNGVALILAFLGYRLRANFEPESKIYYV